MNRLKILLERRSLFKWIITRTLLARIKITNKMGIYICSREEIFDALKDALDNLEGEVFRKDFDNATKDLFNKYKYFSDKKKFYNRK